MLKRTITTKRAAELVKKWSVEGVPDMSDYGLSEDEIAGLARALADAVRQAVEQTWEVIELVIEDPDEAGEVEVYVRQANDGVMVGWFLDDWRADMLTVDGGETDLHMTVAYFGDADDLSDEDQQKLLAVVARVTSETPALYGYIEGTGTFENEDATVWWAQPHIEGLTEYRDRLLDALADAGISVDGTHPDYHPHITLAYLDAGAEPPAVDLPEIPSILIDEITVCIGGTRVQVKFGPVDSEAYDEWHTERYGEHYENYPDSGGAFVPLVKSLQDDERRFTLGPWYIPDTLDAHGDWTTADELQEALWRYVDRGYRQIHLQHSTEIVNAGRWVEIMSLPWPITVPIIDVDGLVTEHTYPAGTVLLGVVWEEWCWPLVKAGKIKGYSIGALVTTHPDESLPALV